MEKSREEVLNFASKIFVCALRKRQASKYISTSDSSVSDKSKQLGIPDPPEVPERIASMAVIPVAGGENASDLACA